MIVDNEAAYEFYCWADEKERQQLWQDLISVHVHAEVKENEN
ncbi:MAG: hypothetical protein SVE93_01915 [Candidatus Thermoplasmatota archaeon]|nr:hypothetical protein [Candidatus Thermoplasmatota archaeon]